MLPPFFIYVHAPFGVILVTTKSGEAGKATIHLCKQFQDGLAPPHSRFGHASTLLLCQVFQCSTKKIPGSGTTFILTDDTDRPYSEIHGG